MDDSTIAAMAGMLLFAAANLLLLLDRSSGRSPPAGKRLGHVFYFFGSAAGSVGLACLVFAKGWQGIVYALATAFAVTAYMRGGLFQIDRPTLIIGALLVIAIVVNVSVLIILWR